MAFNVQVIDLDDDGEFFLVIMAKFFWFLSHVLFNYPGGVVTIFKFFKDNIVYVILTSLLASNVILIGRDFYLKKFLCLTIMFVFVLILFLKKEKVRELIYFFIYLNNNMISKKISGFTALLSWVFFTISLFLLNIGLIVLARWFILLFIVCVIISSIFVFYDLDRSGNIVVNKLKYIFGGLLSLLYFVTSAYSASFFLKFSQMDIGSSPLLEFGWKLTFFAFFLFMLLQPLTYIIFLIISRKLIGHQVMVFFGAMMFTSLLLFAVPKWADNFIVLVLDWATSREWNTSAVCGTLDISRANERYFGFNEEKYTVYFSNRNGKWGFEELQCIKDEGNNDDTQTTSISSSRMPKWFN